MVWKVYTPPAVEPVTLAEAKKQTNCDLSSDETYLSGLIVAAREYVEMICNRALVTQTIDAYYECFPCGDCLVLPRGTLQSISAFDWTDTVGTVRAWTVSGSDLVDSSSVVRAHINAIEEPCEVELAYAQTWPADVLKTSNPVHVRFVCGYGLAAAVPQSIKHAILMLVDHWYGNRSAVTVGNTAAVVSKEMALSVGHLLANYRLYGAEHE